jgi:hypothetical protein
MQSFSSLIRLKGLILLSIHPNHIKTIELYQQKNKQFSFDPSSLATLTEIHKSDNNANNLDEYIIIPLIINWVLGRWSFFFLPLYNPLLSIQTYISDYHTLVTQNNMDKNYTIPLDRAKFQFSTIFTPSSLFSPQYVQHLQTQRKYQYSHSRLTLFGKYGGLSTFNFQKTVSRVLPVTIRKDCCVDIGFNRNQECKQDKKCSQDQCTHDHGFPCQNGFNLSCDSDCNTILESTPLMGGFITTLSKDHSHNHL